MPLRPPAARLRQKRCGAALLLILLTAFFIGAGPARGEPRGENGRCAVAASGVPGVSRRAAPVPVAGPGASRGPGPAPAG